MNIKYVLFDVDGTLTDPQEGICSCINYALGSKGIEEHDWNKLKTYIGPPLQFTFAKYGFSFEESNELIDKYRELYHIKGVHQTVMYEGVPEMLKILKDHGATLAIASCKPSDQSEIIMNDYDIHKYFDYFAGATYDNRILTKDQVIKSALDMMNVTGSKDGAMIGDRDMDINGAHQNGLIAIGSLYGYGNSEELKDADFLASSPLEVAKILVGE